MRYVSRTSNDLVRIDGDQDLRYENFDQFSNDSSRNVKNSSIWLCCFRSRVRAFDLAVVSKIPPSASINSQHVPTLVLRGYKVQIARSIDYDMQMLTSIDPQILHHQACNLAPNVHHQSTSKLESTTEHPIFLQLRL